MRYKIKDIPGEGRVDDLPIPRALFEDALAGLEADLEACAGSLHLELSRLDGTVFAHGAVQASVAVPCVLCLKPAHLRLNVPVKMTFSPEGDERDDDDQPADDLDDEDVGHHDGDTLDLTSTVRELIILSVPFSPRCKEGCRGLCPTCGEDLNTVDCGHDSGAAERPLAALKNLKLNP